MQQDVKIEGQVKTAENGDLVISVNNLCDDCKLEINHYMMTDEVWESCAEKDEVLCFQCFGIRIDRTIYPSDFMDCELNEPFLSWAKTFIHKQTRDNKPKSSGPMVGPR